MIREPHPISLLVTFKGRYFSLGCSTKECVFPLPSQLNNFLAPLIRCHFGFVSFEHVFNSFEAARTNFIVGNQL